MPALPTVTNENELIVFGLDHAGQMLGGFGDQGISRPLLDSFGNTAIATFPEPDGKTLVVRSDGRLLRLNSNGSLDTSYGIGGVSAPYPQDEFGIDVTISAARQADGKILLLKPDGDEHYRFTLRRVDASGNLDPSFGTQGKFEYRQSNIGAEKVAVSSTGKILVLGTGANDFLLFGLDASGNLDSMFGPGGQGWTSLSFSRDSFEQANSVIALPNGKWLVAGGSNRAGKGSFALAQFLANGTLDPEFGTAGITLTSFSSGSNSTAAIKSLLRLADGSIIAVGEAGTDLAIAKYSANGKLDLTFGKAGQRIVDLGGIEVVNDVDILPDGRIVVGGKVVSYADADDTQAFVTAFPLGSIPTTVGFVGVTQTVKESAGTVQVPLVRTGDVTSSLTVHYTTRGRSARAGIDFTSAKAPWSSPPVPGTPPSRSHFARMRFARNAKHLKWNWLESPGKLKSPQT